MLHLAGTFLSPVTELSFIRSSAAVSERSLLLLSLARSSIPIALAAKQPRSGRVAPQHTATKRSAATPDRMTSFGGRNGYRSSGVDLESLEAENDNQIGSLSERVSMLKGITKSIKDEADSQNRRLDDLDRGMSGVSLGLGASMQRIKHVFDGSQNKRMGVYVGGTVLLFFVLYLLVRRG